MVTLLCETSIEPDCQSNPNWEHAPFVRQNTIHRGLHFKLPILFMCVI